MIIVSGCPRSGTSMMMRIMEHAIGRSRMLYSKPDKQPQSQSEINTYLMAKWRDARKLQRSKDMNPNGYYEMAFSVDGIYYRPGWEKKLEQLLREDKPTACKVVSHGLSMSDPRYVDKVVLMARNPLAVAKSQERLTRHNPMDYDSAPQVNGESIYMREVVVFSAGTAAVARWLHNHAQVPVLVVCYDTLLDDPGLVLEHIQAFVGEGDFAGAQHLVDASLRRSTPEAMEGAAVEHAMDLYHKLLACDWAGIVDAADRREAYLLAHPDRWYCPRLDQPVVLDLCKVCKTHPETLVNLREAASERNIPWKSEPCTYECGVRKDGEQKTVAQSIRDNHWN